MKKSAGLMLLITALTSCSVKENRMGCPCTLLVDLSALSIPGGKPRTTEDNLTLSVFEPELVLQHSFELSEHRDCLTVELPRGVMTVSAVLASGGANIRDGEMRIMPGEQSDSLYAFCSTIGAYADTVMLRLHLCKQFTTVSIRIEDAANYYCRIIGNVNGLSMSTLLPTEGDFNYLIEDIGPEGNWSFRMPRQSDRSISMEIISREEREVAAKLPLGELLDSAGYDWNAENLQDVGLYVDPLTKQVSVILASWEEGRTFEYTF